MSPEVSTFDEKGAAVMLSVSVHTLRRWRHERRGPNFVKLPGAAREGHGRAGRVIYRAKDLADFLDQHVQVTE